MKQFLLVFAVFSSLVSCKQEQVAKPELKQLTEAVYASGTLVPEDEYKVMAATDGFLESAFVKEGDTVTKNQLLFQLTSDNRQAEVQAAAQLVQKTLPI